MVANANSSAKADSALLLLHNITAYEYSVKIGMSVRGELDFNEVVVIPQLITAPPSPPPPPISPPSAPPPPEPPSPPSPPPGICENTCALARNGVCNQPCEASDIFYTMEGVKTIKSDQNGIPRCCWDGTDCDDCGVGLFCTDCPAACTKRAYDISSNIESTATVCMQSMWDDGICNSECNNRDCGHNDCTPKESLDKCWPETQRGSDSYLWGSTGKLDLTTPPSSDGRAPDVSALVQLDQVSLAIDEDLNVMIGTWTFKYTLQWLDPRLFESPCALQLGELLSIDAETAKSEVDVRGKRERQKMFWLPTPVFGNQHDNVLMNSQFNISANQLPINDHFEAPCTGCVSYTAEHKLRIKQEFEYFKYPFDLQDISVKVQWQGVNLVNVEKLLGHKSTDGSGSDMDFLPSTGEWLPESDSWVKVGNQEAELEVAGGKSVVKVVMEDGATITFKVRRNPIVFLIKKLAMGVAIVSGGLLALWLHPVEYAGDRSAWLIVAVLIVMTFLNEDLGLGKLYYLIWVDLLNLVFVFILIVALFETIYIHTLIGQRRQKLALAIDRVCRVSIALGIYPVCLMSMIFANVISTVAALSFGTVAIVLIIIGTVCKIKYDMAERERKRKYVFSQLAECDTTDSETHNKLLEMAFHALDEDGSGQIDRSELRVGLQFIFPKDSKERIMKTELSLRQKGSITAVDHLTTQDYMDTVDAVGKHLEQTRSEGDEELTKRSSRGGLSRRAKSSRDVVDTPTGTSKSRFTSKGKDKKVSPTLTSTTSAVIEAAEDEEFAAECADGN